MDEIIGFYIKEGFGWASKSELDLFMFSRIRNLVEFKGLSPYELAHQLKITESKVRNLILRSHMRYPPQDKHDYIQDLAKRVIEKKCEYVLGSGNIKFEIDNPIEKMEVENAIRSADGFIDYSHNKHVLSISLPSFIKLLDATYESFEKKFSQSISSQIKKLDAAQKKAYKELPPMKKIQRFVEKNKAPLSLLSSTLGTLIGAPG